MNKVKVFCDDVCNLIFGLVKFIVKNPKKTSLKSTFFWILWCCVSIIFLFLLVAMGTSGDPVATFLSLTFLFIFIVMYIPGSIAYVNLNIGKMKEIKAEPWVVKPEPGIPDDCWPR